MTPKVLAQADGILLRPAERRSSLDEIDGLWIHQGTPEPDAPWAHTLEAVRDERLGAVLKI